MTWIQIAGAIIVFAIDIIRRFWKSDDKKETEYAYLEKQILQAIKDKDLARYVNLRAKLLELRKR